MESIFEVIAEPSRRAILGLLASSPQSVGEIERRLGLSQPAASKHLRVLREARFVQATVDAQRRVYRLRLAPFREFDAWLAQFRGVSSMHSDALEQPRDHHAKPVPKSSSAARIELLLASEENADRHAKKKDKKKKKKKRGHK